MISVSEICPYCGTSNEYDLADIDVLDWMNGKMLCNECGEGVLICSECEGCYQDNDRRRDGKCFRLHPDWELDDEDDEEDENYY
jgi:hypothetical protein